MTANEPSAKPAGEAGHEETEVRVRPVLLATVVIVMLCLGSALASGVLLVFLEGGRDSTLGAQGRVTPPMPRQGPALQPAPTVDLAEMLAEEKVLLETYGWVDRELEIVRLPIARAMELIMERGLPKAAAPATSPVTPAVEGSLAPLLPATATGGAR